MYRHSNLLLLKASSRQLIASNLVRLPVGGDEDVLALVDVVQHIGCAAAPIELLGHVALALLVGEGQEEPLPLAMA